MKNIVLIFLGLVFSFTSLLAQCAEGDCVNGTGIMVFKSGNKYKGEFKNGKRDGRGTFVWTSGAKYKGQWMQDKMHGEGTYIFPNRNVYRGQYVNGLREGIGTLTNKDGKVLSKGTWSKDNFVDEAARNYHYIMAGAAVYGLDIIDLPVTGTMTYYNPIFLSYNHSLVPSLGIGLMVGTSSIAVSVDSDSQITNNASYRDIYIGGKVNYYLTFLKNDFLLPYVSGTAGYRLAQNNIPNPDITTGRHYFDNPSSIFYGVHGGVKVNLFKGFGAFAEGGIGYSIANAGIFYRL